MAASAFCHLSRRRRKNPVPRILKVGFVLFCLPLALFADQLRFDTARDWRAWQLPFGAVELSLDGTIKPAQIRKNINASLNADGFGGGIRDAGSNQGDAHLVLDGDLTTGWSPAPEADPDD